MVGVVLLSFLVCSCGKQDDPRKIIQFPGGRTHDYRVKEFHLPGLKNQRCAQIAKSAVMGVTRFPNMGNAIAADSIKFDLERKIMFVEFDTMRLGMKNIEHQIARAGLTANDIPADTNAVNRLPAECR
jgi:hypothetical protein